MNHFVPLKKTNPSMSAVCRLAVIGLAVLHPDEWTSAARLEAQIARANERLIEV